MGEREMNDCEVKWEGGRMENVQVTVEPLTAAAMHMYFFLNKKKEGGEISKEKGENVRGERDIQCCRWSRRLFQTRRRQ